MLQLPSQLNPSQINMIIKFVQMLHQWTVILHRYKKIISGRCVLDRLALAGFLSGMRPVLGQLTRMIELK
jgi:hypothetical protein